MIFSKEKLLEELQEYRNNPHSGFKCGLSIDDAFRLDKKSLVIFTAKPCDGKTTFLNYYSYLMAKQNRWKTIFFSFESSIGRQTDDMYNYFDNFNVLDEYCKIADTNNVKSLENIYKDIREAKSLYGVDMVIIDTFTNLNPYIGDVNTTTIGNTLTAFSSLAKELDICMVITAHPTKLNADEEINAYSICGSANFFNLSDYIISLSITNREKRFTKFTALKIRENLDKGLVGKSVTLKFDPYNKIYQEITDEEQDEPLESKRDKVVKEVAEQMVLKGDQQLTPQNQTINKNILQRKVSLFQKVIGSKTRDLTIEDALNLGMQHKQDIDYIRSIDREKDGDKYKEERQKRLPIFTISALMGSGRKNEDIIEYSNIIAVDIDAKDNTQYSKEELRNKITSFPYVFYCAQSVGGKGYFALIELDGGKDDFKPHFNAIEDDFNTMGIKIDNACKDMNRVRFVSYDDEPYTNMNAIIYTKKIVSPLSSHANMQEVKDPLFGAPIAPKEKLNPKEKQDFSNAMRDIEINHIQVTTCHQDTITLACVLKRYFPDKEGMEYLETIRAQRGGYKKGKTYTTYRTADPNKRTNPPKINLFFKMYWDAKKLISKNLI